jgi:uncharacterized protein (DUF2062 family)
MNFLPGIDTGLLTNFVERFPHVSILASLSGCAASVLAIMKVLSVLLGVAGGVFSLLAGYYTFRVYYRKWQRAKAEDAAALKASTIATYIRDNPPS